MTVGKRVAVVSSKPVVLNLFYPMHPFNRNSLITAPLRNSL